MNLVRPTLNNCQQKDIRVVILDIEVILDSIITNSVDSNVKIEKLALAIGNTYPNLKDRFYNNLKEVRVVLILQL